ncbi:MAG: hypothetical protein JO054_12385, partial [Actinobacteria bacterium]|nr:hypothetical protein [Actinomycetota bacterium]
MRRQLGATLFASFVIVAVAAPVGATPSAKKPVVPPPGWVVDRVRFEPLDSAPLGVDFLVDYPGTIE